MFNDTISMSDDRPKRDTITIEEVTVSNMWEIAAIVEVLERKDLCTKQDLYDIITEFRRKNLRAKIPETAFPEPVPVDRNREHDHRPHSSVAEQARADLAPVDEPT
jgi:hypothetical protein